MPHGALVSNSVALAETLNLGDNDLSGPIPLGLSGMKRLRTMRLEKNRLNGTIPLELSSMVSLQEFNAYGNNLGGVLPSTLDTMPYLGGLTVATLSEERCPASHPCLDQKRSTCGTTR